MSLPVPDDAYGRADLHLHTTASDGLMSWRRLLDHVEERTSLDVIAITDHDETCAGQAAREHAARYGYRVQVVPGVEVTTRHGHLLCLFVDERPPAFRSVAETAEWVLGRGGLCVAPHPFTRIVHSLGQAVLQEAVQAGLVAGIEVLNPSPAGRGSHRRAGQFARQHPVAAVGASDAHWPRIVGMAHTRFPGRSPEDLRRAIAACTTQAEGRFTRPGEMVREALPQTVWATAILGLRRLPRLRSGLSRPAARRAA